MFLEEIKKLSSNYLIAKGEKFANNPLREDFCRNAPRILKQEARISNTFKIVASCGQGGWADIPWICIMDKRITTSPQQGYYIAYLFSADLKKIYLSLALGWTQYEKQFGDVEGRIRARMTVSRVRKLYNYSFGDFSLDPINLGTNNRAIRARGYESGTIFHKVYDLERMPTEAVLLSDFKTILNFYQELHEKIGNKLSDLTAPNENQVMAEEFDEKVSRVALGIRSPEEARKKLDELSNEIKREPVAIRYIKARRLARNAKFSKLVKEGASYICQICGEKPFQKINNQPYAEAHHKEELSSSRIDHPDNMVCVCPLCHRIIHYGAQEELEKRKNIGNKN